MSFILDALKKLEHKRHQGTVPDLMTIHTHGPQEPKKRALWPYLLFIALLLNAGILLAWLRPWQAEEQPSAEQTKAIIEDQKKTEPSRADPADIETAEPAAKPVETKEASTEVKVVNSESKPDAKSVEVIAEAKPETTVTDAAPPLISTETDKTGTDTDNENAEAIEDSTVKDRLSSLNLDMTAQELEILKSKIREERSEPYVNQPSIPPHVDTSSPGTDPTVYDLNQLPEEIRSELPDVDINSHIYSNNPKSRLVNINGYIIREGEEVAKGLKVDEITMSGVILTYRDYRFRMRAF